MTEIMLIVTDLDTRQEYTLWADGSFCLEEFGFQFVWTPIQNRQLDPALPLTAHRLPFGSPLYVKKGNTELC